MWGLGFPNSLFCGICLSLGPSYRAYDHPWTVSRQMKAVWLDGQPAEPIKCTGSRPSPCGTPWRTQPQNATTKVQHALKTESCHDANFVVTGGPGVSPMTTKRWHHDNSRVWVYIPVGQWNEYMYMHLWCDVMYCNVIWYVTIWYYIWYVIWYDMTLYICIYMRIYIYTYIYIALPRKTIPLGLMFMHIFLNSLYRRTNENTDCCYSFCNWFKHKTYFIYNLRTVVRLYQLFVINSASDLVPAWLNNSHKQL